MDNIVFGLRPVVEAIEAGRQIEKIYIRKGSDGGLIGELHAIARVQRITLQEVPVEKLDRLTRGNHQGVVAQMSAIVYSDIGEILAAVPEGRAGLLVVFDGVTDVRNFGGVARTAECAGADGLIVPMKNAAPVNADALKASAGALNIIPVCRVGSVRNTLKLLQAEGYHVVAATEKASKSIYEVDFKVPTAIVMGSEDTGVSREVLKLCDEQAAIPLMGRIGSLNVAAAAAVILFETVRQRINY